MRFLPTKIFPALGSLISVEGLSAEDRRRRSYLAVCLGLLILIGGAFWVEDLQHQRSMESALALAMLAMLSFVLVALMRARELRPIFRIGAVAMILLHFYEVKIGGGEGYAFLWFFCFPILCVTVFGRREGAVWALTAMAFAALGFSTPLGHVYELGTAARFLIIYMIVVIFADALESSRSRYYARLLEEKTSLEDALSQVRTLRGLLPICAQCKKVRGDEGYWQQIELYVNQHAETEFSHSMCPNCAAELYPELAGELG